MALPTLGADIYFANSSAGSNNGADCSDAYSVTDSTHGINIAGNWSPGNTLHLCGTITGTAGSTKIHSAGSGTSTNPITVKFESGASLQAPYWGTGGGNITGAIVISGNNYITVDGGTNGFIQNTLNGTAGGACPAGSCTNPPHDSSGMVVNNCTGCTVQNLGIYNIYVRTSTSDTTGASVGGRGLSKEGTASNLTINNVTIHDASSCIFLDVPNGAADVNIAIENSNLYQCSGDIDVGAGSGSTGTLTGLILSGSHLHDATNWNDPAPPYNFHHDGLHIWSYSGTKVTGVQVFDNVFDGDIGSGTSWVYFENYSSKTETIQVFNNLFHETSTTCLFSCGPFSLWLQNDVPASVLQAKIYNNTFLGANDSMGGITVEGTSGLQYDLRNNTLQGYSNLLYIQNGAPLPLSTSDNNNWYFAGNALINAANLAYNILSFATWQLLCSCDSHAITANPNLTASFTLGSGSPAKSAGQNLTSMSIIPLDSDLAGTPRPASGNWDIGAYSVASVGGGQPTAPTGMTAQVK